MINVIARFRSWLVPETPDEPQDAPDTFLDELTALLNKHSMENDSGTPDHVLAQYLKSCLGAFDKAVQGREAWHGKRPYENPYPHG